MTQETTGTTFVRGDVESLAGRPLTKDEWEAVKATYEWHKGIPEALTQHGWEILREALKAAGIKPKE